MHFIIGVRIDYAPQPGMQRRVPPERRIHREVTRPAVFLRPGSQAGAQQRGQITVHLLLVEGVGDVRFPHQLAEPPVESGVGRRRGWRRVLTPLVLVRQLVPPLAFVRELLQLGDTTALPTVRTVLLDHVDQAARRE